MSQVRSIHVCSLARLHDTVAATGARHVVTLINVATPVARPSAIAESNHLFIGINDIVEEMPGFVAPGEAHVARLLDFVRAWHAEREAPLVVHCWAGISRSTAAAFTTVCALAPARDELEIALALRAASPTATPNLRIVRHADALLGRRGRMVAAIEAIGRGIESPEGAPFSLSLD
ncbi:tyrosine phosphatase family protein [Blastochloris sulfoviridis]|uniref:Protein tyrosine phosphatase n=1 Tax=Blastochloris sulfoviridis TaxID=50712 RepID=A0A5M6I4M0_9HYPH|nr:protein-tyrosine phosphatase family protein [Blastochloris sulfoviridis]KAA5603122.1 protein tyrosine phosphatase [Blastochloris sulfoviridis]